ncbi:hypothetical protein HUG17_9788 [Dermatophagoides farinae]|uniref:Uncharacterized protein n=1 Tax=Dermatophagoides farinae TaxID=6954 RepID=A0A9D4P317_DERFA|nr:hypothetical protein HUG17_9788 [Dermatophagoides farinae]
MAMFMMIIMISTLIIGTTRIDARNIKDDDCMDIAMRPLPRFGKRSSDLNRETINRVRRSCIINRRQSKSISSPTWLQDSKDSLSMESNPLQQQQQQQQQPQQQQQLSSSSLLRRFPAWKHLLDQLAAQKEKMIIDHLLNIRLNPTLSINQQQTQQNNNPDTLEQQQSSIEQQQQQQKTTTTTTTTRIRMGKFSIYI